MKNKILVISAFLLAAAVLDGCDMFRSLAGRPTSTEIEAMRGELVAREAAEAARQDSLMRERAAAAQAARIEAAIDTLYAMTGYLRSPARFGGLASDSAPSAKYSIVTASFLDKDNALKYSEKLSEDGYPSEVVSFRNGFNAVGACPTDDPSELLISLRKVRQEPFCPKEVWILVNE